MSTNKRVLFCYLLASALSAGCEPEVTSLGDFREVGRTGEHMNMLQKVELMEEYIVINETGPKDQRRKWLDFDWDRAFEDGVSMEVINLADDIVYFEEHKEHVPAHVEEFFLKYSSGYFAQGEEYTQEHQGLIAIEQGLFSSCGGNRENPARCEPYVHNSQTWSTEREVIDELKRLQYHKTSSRLGSQYDYTLRVNYPCGEGVYRLQALIERRGDRWSYKVQHDLNPELWTFAWPSWWWPSYVGWWHRFHCN